jgi:hypothetical protein
MASSASLQRSGRASVSRRLAIDDAGTETLTDDARREADAVHSDNGSAARGRGPLVLRHPWYGTRVQGRIGVAGVASVFVVGCSLLVSTSGLDDQPNANPSQSPNLTVICHGADAAGKLVTCSCDARTDADNDGHFDCEPDGTNPDCNDRDPAVFPGAREVCNEKDDDCDGVVDNGFDKDGDGFFACAQGATAADCDDTDPQIHPGAKEVCNGKDDDCNGRVDDAPALLHGSLVEPVDKHWVAAGAAILGTARGAQLNADVAGQAGAIWWNASYVFDSFDVTSTFAIQAKPNGADGCAFAWIPGGNPQSVGAAAGYGVVGLGGYAVAIDTYQNGGEPQVPFLHVRGPDQTIGTYVLPQIRDDQNHTLRVKLDAGRVSAWVDSVAYVTDRVLPGYVPFTGHFGWGGGGGGSFEAHYVTDVAMSFPSGQGCVP